MGEPEDPAGFVRLEVDDVTVYVARPLLDRLEPGAGEMCFYVDGYGRFRLRFAQPGPADEEQ